MDMLHISRTYPREAIILRGSLGSPLAHVLSKRLISFEGADTPTQLPVHRQCNKTSTFFEQRGRKIRGQRGSRAVMSGINQGLAGYFEQGGTFVWTELRWHRICTIPFEPAEA